MREFIIQAIGLLGAALIILSYQIRSSRRLFLCQLLGCVLFLVQFTWMGAYTGAASLAINIARNLLLLKARDWPWAGRWWTLAVLLALLVLLTGYTWDGWISLLPFLSVAVTSVGYWTRNARKLRVSQLFGAPCTLVYDLLVGSWGGALCESFALASILVSILRFGWKRLGEDQEADT